MTVRPSASQGQYEVAYTGYNPMLNPVFLARNRMLTPVVAKQAKTTKVKTNLLMDKKKFKRILSCLFGGRRKVQFRRKKLGDKVQAKSSNLPSRFCRELGRHTA